MLTNFDENNKASFNKKINTNDADIEHIYFTNKFKDLYGAILDSDWAKKFSTNDNSNSTTTNTTHKETTTLHNESNEFTNLVNEYMGLSKRTLAEILAFITTYYPKFSHNHYEFPPYPYTYPPYSITEPYYSRTSMPQYYSTKTDTKLS